MSPVKVSRFRVDCCIAGAEIQHMNNEHIVIDPALLYFGTPVVLVSTTNPDGTAHLAPMSSAWWLGRSCMLGFGARSHTPANLLRTGECVLNLRSVVPAATSTARPTGIWLHAVPSDGVRPPRVAECPVQLEAVLEGKHRLAESDELRRGNLIAIEVRIVRVHVHPSIRMPGHANRIDPRRWKPLIMNFCEFFSLGDVVHSSTLAEIPEEAYRPKLRTDEVAVPVRVPVPGTVTGNRETSRRSRR